MLEERKEEAEELAILVRNKAEVVKTLERRLLNAQRSSQNIERRCNAETNPRHKTTHPHQNSNTSRQQTFASAPTAWPPYMNDTTRFSRR